MFQNRQLLEKIFTKTQSGKEYIVFSHDDKIWLMPKESLKKAFDMYQPSTIKGKVLKTLIKKNRSRDKILEKLQCKRIKLTFSESLKSYIEKFTGELDLEVSAYMGDTSSRQNNKVTLQIYDESGIICYAKITDDEEVAKTFDKEISNLNYLQDKHIENIPAVLGNDMMEGLRVFVQSTNKLPNEKVKIQFRKRQIEFIKNICEKTEQKLKYEETDFYKMVQHLKENLEDFSDNQQQTIYTAISIIEEKLTKEKSDYAFSHGDYTPWNVYYVNGELYAFDFEYCNKTMPCFIDIFHYLTQLSVLGKRNGIGKTVHLYKKYRKMLEQYIPNPNFIYMCYLVSIISFYHNRTRKQLELIRSKFDTWVGLLDYLNNK